MRVPDSGFTQGASLSQAWPNDSHGLPFVHIILPPGALHKVAERVNSMFSLYRTGFVP